MPFNPTGIDAQIQGPVAETIALVPNAGMTINDACRQKSATSNIASPK